MKSSNNYISLDQAMQLIQRGWIFRQDIKQTSFFVKRGENSFEQFKLNKKNAIALKQKMSALSKQIKINV